MPYRLAAFAIVVFWLVMTSLLVLNEVNPEDSSVREVPLSHVMKVLYLHEQPSDLRIYSGGTAIGHLRMQPRVQKDTGDRTLEFAGSIQVQMAEGRSRISWDGTMVMSPTFDLRRSDWGVSLHDPGFIRAEVRTSADNPLAHLVLRTKDHVLEERDVSMSEAGLSGLIQQFGASPEMVVLIQQAKAQAKAQAQPTIRARQSSLRYRGERTETYLVSIEQNGQTLLQCHLSQLGQILQAKTILGYTLQPDDLLP